MLFQFVDASGVRRTMRFDRLSKREFEQVRFRCKRMVAFQLAKEPYDRETLTWIEGLTDYIRKKLMRSGLIATKERALLEERINRFIDSRAAVNPKTGRSFSKPSTLQVFKRCRKKLLAFFGGDKPVCNITKGHAREWHRWMMTELGSENTVRRQTGIAKQFFEEFVDHKLIDENPFKGLPCSVQANRTRDFFISEADSMQVLEWCPDLEWKLIFSLARWGGLRVPSEVFRLKLSDVDWERHRMTVNSPKTEHHAGKESRVIPIFPELRPHLEAVFDAAEEGQVYFVKRNRIGSTNLRTRFEKIIRRAGLKPWPKLFQNLRATRETELADRFPIQTVVSWIGNSEPIAKKNYLQVREEHFSAAVSMQNRCTPLPPTSISSQPNA